MEFESLMEDYKNELLPDHHPYYDRVAKVATRIIKSNINDMPELKKQNWTVSVIAEAENKNAFVLPSGNIFVFTGMLSVCSNDDQVCMSECKNMQSPIGTDPEICYL